ncbi:MAG: carboxylate--amine ligase [Desulfobacterales bacterium]
MNIVFLSPHFPPHYTAFCSQLRSMGANVLGIADASFDSLSPGLRNAITEYYRVDDMHNYDGLVRALGYFTHRYGKIDRLDSLNEYWLGTEARLRDDFNIFGVRSSQIDVIRRKSFMKERFIEAGISVARGRVVNSLDEAKALIALTGYPVVAKPDAGVGALDTWRLENDNDLIAFFARKPPVDYIMEEFIKGTIVSFDGLADINGEPVFHTSHIFSQGIMETVNEKRDIHYWSQRRLSAGLEEIGRACLKAFDVQERFFHIEFFETAPNNYVALEVNMRPPGGYTTDMFNWACDIDIYRLWAELLVFGRNRLDYRLAYHCCYASRRQGRRYRQSHEEVVNRCGAALMNVVSVPGVFSSALGDVGYIFRYADQQEMIQMVQFIQEPEH